MAPNATDAESYDEDPNDQVTWFSNKFYSGFSGIGSPNFNPSDRLAWWSLSSPVGTGFHPSDNDFQNNSNFEYIVNNLDEMEALSAVSYTHLRAHETDSYLVCRLLLEKS